MPSLDLKYNLKILQAVAVGCWNWFAERAVCEIAWHFLPLLLKDNLVDDKEIIFNVQHNFNLIPSFACFFLLILFLSSMIAEILGIPKLFLILVAYYGIMDDTKNGKK